MKNDTFQQLYVPPSEETNIGNGNYIKYPFYHVRLIINYPKLGRKLLLKLSLSGEDSTTNLISRLARNGHVKLVRDINFASRMLSAVLLNKHIVNQFEPPAPNIIWGKHLPG